MKNTIRTEDNLDEKDDLVDGLKSPTILSEGNQEKEKNVSQKADFESMGKFTGIGGLSKEFKGLSSLVENEKDLGEKNTNSNKPKSKQKFDVFADYDDEDEDQQNTDDPLTLQPEIISDSDILPEIIKDDDFEGEFDGNDEYE